MTPRITALFLLAMPILLANEECPPSDVDVDVDGDGYAFGDCDDQNPDIHPDAEELCDGIDQNCDGIVDEDLMRPHYPDRDEDGFGDSLSAGTSLCPGEGAASAGLVPNDEDCDDRAATTFPGAEERCDGVDQDCDGAFDEGLANVPYYWDEDGDGYGDPDRSVIACAPPPGYVALDGDCDDAAATTHPGAPDIDANGVDDNCSGYPDEVPLDIDAGVSHTLAAYNDGSLWAWGNNDFGQLGQGHTDPLIGAQRILLEGDPDIRVCAVEAGDGFSVALTCETGRVYTWGRNDDGQLGTGTRVELHAPQRIVSLSDVVALSAAGTFTLAQTRHGAVYTWGRGDEGQLGQGSTLDALLPKENLDLFGADAFSAGPKHGVALIGGAPHYWGEAGGASCGASGATRPRPMSNPYSGSFVDVATGAQHSLFLDGQGHVWSCGSNGSGQLCNNTTTAQPDIRKAPLSSSYIYTSIDAGRTHSLLMLDWGAVQGCGSNYAGQLGQSLPGTYPSPRSVGYATGMSAGDDHTLLWGEGGRVDVCGANEDGELGLAPSDPVFAVTQPDLIP